MFFCRHKWQLRISEDDNGAQQQTGTQPVYYILVTLKFFLLYFRECLCVNNVLLPPVFKTYYTVCVAELLFALLAFKVDP